ncbi:MAG: hypothetical protein ABJA84_00130 [Polaromonas sp.]
MMYLTRTGDEITKEQIQSAFAAGHAVLCHSNGEGRTVTGLALDGVEYDTRGECYSVWDETWTTAPKSLAQCYAVARC